MKASDAIIKEWAERHDLQGTLTDLRACFDDARSLSSTPPVDTSTAGNRYDTWLHKATMDIRVIDPSAGGRAHEQIYDVLDRLVESRLAALREQLANLREAHILQKQIDDRKLASAEAALNQMREALRLISDVVPRFQVAFSMPAGFPVSKQLPPQGYDVWLHDFIAGVIKVQPDSTALKTVIEARTRELIAKFGGPEAVAAYLDMAERLQATEAVLQQHREWMEEDGMREDGVPVHDCDFNLSPESGTCSFHELYAATVAALSDSAQKAGQPANAT